MTKIINIVVNGANGRMGKELISSISENPETTKVVGAVSRTTKPSTLTNNGEQHNIEYGTDLDFIVKTTKADLVIDFTSRAGAMYASEVCQKYSIDYITGSSGLSEDDISELRNSAEKSNIGIFVGPNFSLGAIMIQYLSTLAGKHFDYADIIEMHHAGKLDAPSGSALALASDMIDARQGRRFTETHTEKINLKDARGGNFKGIGLHSIRLPGVMARQEIILGGQGETISLIHNTTNRNSYMPGILKAAEFIVQHKGFYLGLGSILDLS